MAASNDRGRGSIACAKPVLGMKRMKEESVISRIKTKMRDAKELRQANREVRQEERDNNKRVGPPKGKDQRLGIDYRPSGSSRYNFNTLKQNDKNA